MRGCLAAVALAVAAAAAVDENSPTATFDDDEARCSSCVVTVAELLDAVADEKPSMNLKVGMHAGRGARTVDYGVSELRATEMLEGLCARMEAYRLMVDSVRHKGRVAYETPYLQKLGGVPLERLAVLAPPFLEVLVENVDIFEAPFGEPLNKSLFGDVSDLAEPRFKASLGLGDRAAIAGRSETRAGFFLELADGRGFVLDDEGGERTPGKPRIHVHALRTDGGAAAVRLRHALTLECAKIVEGEEARFSAALQQGMRPGAAGADAAAAARELALDVCVRCDAPACADAAAVDALPPHNAELYAAPARKRRRKHRKRKKPAAEL
jgi:hypothetical protein